MTIKKGQSWGKPGSLPDGGVVVRSDADARTVLEEARRRGRPYPPLGLLGGDLWRTLGGTGNEARLRSHQATTFTVDVGQVLVDGSLHLFVAHLVARTRLWTRALVVMNAQWLTTQAGGHWNLGPRAHPGDGLLDVYRVRLGVADLPRVRRRLHHGAHLPHPGIKEQRTTAVQTDVGRPLPVRLDGVDIGRGRALSVRVELDALTVVV
ncbi:MAG: hypothetical protein M3396_08645 [Actinomycetota bacterium]|nr:hypothetical protein [Actinomycetota bacterium]MDQ3575322.1 hypothetical protein [Actinomycetota bacterium]